MSLAHLFPVDDTPVTIGVVQFQADIKLPVYIVEFPADRPSFSLGVTRHKRMNLDITPTEGGFTFYVTSDRVITELTPEKLERAANCDPADFLSTLTAEGTPEFSSCSETTKEAHDMFAEARAVLGGYWMLVVLTEDATEIVMDSQANIVRMQVRERSAYALG